MRATAGEAKGVAAVGAHVLRVALASRDEHDPVGEEEADEGVMDLARTAGSL